MQIGNFLEIVIFVSAFLSIVLILLQRRGASLGAGFGSSGELYTKRLFLFFRLPAIPFRKPFCRMP